MSSSKPEAKHEPLTNAELVILANREYDVEHIGERAVADIRGLRGELSNSHQVRSKMIQKLRTREAANAKVLEANRELEICNAELISGNAKLREAVESNKREAGNYWRKFETAQTEAVNLRADNAKLRAQVETLADGITKINNCGVQLRRALERANLALDDWLNRYASDLCDPDRVAQARSRITNQGGTIAYITDVRTQGEAALASGGKADSCQRPAVSSEPLTGIQLKALETITKTPLLGSSLGKAAAAEIRKLRANCEEMGAALENMTRAWKEQRADNADLLAALEKYGRHRDGCGAHSRVVNGIPRDDPALKCICGLDAELASGGKADSHQRSAVSSEPEIKNPPDALSECRRAILMNLGTATDLNIGADAMAYIDRLEREVLAAEPAGPVDSYVCSKCETHHLAEGLADDLAAPEAGSLEPEATQPEAPA